MNIEDQINEVLTDASPVMRNIGMAIVSLHLIGTSRLSGQERVKLWFALLKTLCCETTQFDLQQFGLTVIDSKDKKQIMGKVRLMIKEIDEAAVLSSQRFSKLLDELIPTETLTAKDLH